MKYWTPSCNEIREWKPNTPIGMNFSERDKMKYMNLTFFFTDKLQYNQTKSEIIAQMIIFKHKYKGLMYSAEQEELIKMALLARQEH